MRRPFPPAVWLTALALLVAAGVVGGRAWRSYTQVQSVGRDVYHELDGDGLPVPRGVLDDPVFRAVPPPDRPVSFGRYKAPVPVPAPTPRTQPSAAQPSKTQSSKTQSSETRSSPPPAPSTVKATPAPALPAAPSAFLDRVATPARLHLLLIANDQETLGSGRGDVLLVLTLDPEQRRMTLLSIPRDTRVDLPGHGVQKINAAYALDGTVGQTQAVERFLGIPMDKYVEISLGGFRRVIDLLGGVDVHPRFAFELDGSAFRPGTMHLTGEQALAYTRMRKADPQGDLGRNTRQQEVVRTLLSTLGRRPADTLPPLLEQLSAQLRTNFSPSEVVALRTRHEYLTTRQAVAHVQGTNRRVGGVWYYVVPDQERQRLHVLLR